METPDFLTALINQPETVLVLLTLIVFMWLLRGVIRPAADAFKSVNDRQEKSIDKIEEQVEGHTAALSSLVELARVSADALAVVLPNTQSTLSTVKDIQTDVAQIHTDLSTKEHSVEALLARIADTTEQNNGLLNTLNENVRETHDQLQRLANNRDLRPDIENLRAAIQAFTAVIADVKDTQDKLVNSANHIAKQTTGEHAAVVAEEKVA